MISMVAAMGTNNVIGNNGHLPWSKTMKNDIKHYSDLIRGQTIIMGSNTFREADHVRSHSRIVVLSRQDLDLPNDVTGVHSVEEILALDTTDEELFVTGGGGVFHLMLDHADRLYLTIIKEEFKGDVFFPKVDDKKWKVTEKEDFQKDEQNKYDYSFLTYQRI